MQFTLDKLDKKFVRMKNGTMISKDLHAFKHIMKTAESSNSLCPIFYTPFSCKESVSPCCIKITRVHGKVGKGEMKGTNIINTLCACLLLKVFQRILLELVNP